MKIIDAHAHIFPEKIADKAVESIGNFYSHGMDHKGSSRELLDSGKRAGVEKFLVFSTATKAEQVESINGFILDEVSKHKEFIGLGTMHIDYTDFEKELKKIKASGLNGIKLHPDFQHFNFNDKRLYPIFETLISLDMFVLTHAGDFRYEYSNPLNIAAVAKDFPKLNIMAAHFGGWSQWDIAADNLNLPNVFFDTSSTLPFTDPDTVNKMFNAYDRSHLFFGTDFPMWDHLAEIENVKKYIKNEQELEDIFYNNFINFYKNYDASIS